MVLLTVSYKLFLALILLLNFRVVAEGKPTTTDVIDISSEIEVIDTEILDLEVSYEMG